ncbi:M15 family metallopeptidase [Nonomuraea dietziae]|uniref:M15 family metallopeptidase n=1 Tax=Nonomuraea dietziae TaxID=65515 RepID=UPI0034077482
MKRAIVAVLSLVVACGTSPAPTASSDLEPSGTATPTSSQTPTPAPTPTPPTPTGPPAFESKVSTLKRDQLPYSWRPGCPVHYRDLRLITMTYWGFDDKAHTGELVVRENVTDDIVSVFQRLYRWRYPIKSMKLVDVFKGSDFDSIDANNTSAFNCRQATGSGSWSKHAYGEAVDLNPRENPYVTASGDTAHANARRFTERPLDRPGVINPGDRVVKAFAAVGWEWGGSWSGTKDYQHFSKGGG